MKSLEDRHTEAIRRLGGACALLELPDEVKDILKRNYDLETKTKMLEAVADQMEKGGFMKKHYTFEEFLERIHDMTEDDFDTLNDYQQQALVVEWKDLYR